MQLSEETALVSHIKDTFVYLETQNQASCGNCRSKSGCGNISSIFTLKIKNNLRMKNTLNLKEGDSVVVGMPTEKLLLVTGLMYMLPLILLFILAYIAKIYLGETMSIIAGLVGFFGGFLLVKQLTRIGTIAEFFRPKLIRKIIKVDAI